MASLAANAADEETQKLRYAALNGKKVLLLSNTIMVGNTIHDVAESTKWFCRWIMEQGCEVGWATPKGYEHDNLLKIYTENKLYNKLIEVDDMESDQAHFSIKAACERENWIPDGIYSHIENMQPLLGATCEAFGILNNSHAAYQLARNKLETRKACGAAGLATTKTCEVWTVEDVDKAAGIVGFPMVVKPSSGAGSQGVYRADTVDELRQLVARVLEDCKTSVQLVYNPGVADDTAPVFCETCMIPTVWEDYPVGEFDCDLLIWDGELMYGDVVDNWKPLPPFYMENGANFPTVVSDKARDELVEYAFKCVKALGFIRGAFHVECMYTDKDGAILIEVNARAGGGPSREFHLSVNGIDMMLNAFLAHMGIPINPPRNLHQIAAIGYDFCAPKTGVMVECDFMENIKDHEWVAKTVYYKKKGDKVVGLDTAVPDWIGHLRLEAPADKIREAVMLCTKMADEAIPVIKIEAVANPPRRRSSMRNSLLDEVEHLTLADD